MDSATIGLLSQIPLAGVVVFLSIYLTNRFLSHLKTEAENNRSFLREQRAQNNLALARLAEELKSNTLEIRTSNIAMAQHCEAVDKNFDHVISLVGKPAGAKAKAKA